MTATTPASTTAVPTLAVPEPPFSLQLREGTTKAHEHAETRGFVDALLAGSVSRAAVVDLWAQYRWIYAELEATGDRLADDPVIGAFVIEELRRTPALDHDLLALGGPDWDRRYAPTGATEAYVSRLAALDGPRAAGFVAHHYTRYLGDLAGGQVIARALGRREDLAGIELAFPVFERLEDRPRFRERYRARLDAVPWDAEVRARVVDEARVAFALNARLFDDLGVRHLDGPSA
jgi:heme oxygenase